LPSSHEENWVRERAKRIRDCLSIGKFTTESLKLSIYGDKTLFYSLEGKEYQSITRYIEKILKTLEKNKIISQRGSFWYLLSLPDLEKLLEWFG